MGGKFLEHFDVSASGVETAVNLDGHLWHSFFLSALILICPQPEITGFRYPGTVHLSAPMPNRS